MTMIRRTSLLIVSPNRLSLNFVLTECNTEDSDNIELHIANYYDHFPKEKPDEPDTPPGDDTPDVPDGKKVWF